MKVTDYQLAERKQLLLQQQRREIELIKNQGLKIHDIVHY